MSAATIPAAVAAIQAPTWATEGLKWERDGVDGFTRLLEHGIGEHVSIRQGQSWDPIVGLTVHEREICGLDGIMSLYDGDDETAADAARVLAAELLEAARVLDAAGRS